LARVNLLHRWREINALFPVYDTDGGNATVVLFAGGERQVDSRKTRTLVSTLARLFAVDLDVLKQRYGRHLERERELPLPLHPDLVLVPVRMRRPLGKDHGALGYLVRRQVVGCGAGKAGEVAAVITFADGTCLGCLNNPATIRRQLRLAAEAERLCREVYAPLSSASTSGTQRRVALGRFFTPGVIVADGVCQRAGTVREPRRVVYYVSRCRHCAERLSDRHTNP